MVHDHGIASSKSKSLQILSTRMKSLRAMVFRWAMGFRKPQGGEAALSELGITPLVVFQGAGHGGLAVSPSARHTIM